LEVTKKEDCDKEAELKYYSVLADINCGPAGHPVMRDTLTHFFKILQRCTTQSADTFSGAELSITQKIEFVFS
jgi:hypothetical protein